MSQQELSNYPSKQAPPPYNYPNSNQPPTYSPYEDPYDGVGTAPSQSFANTNQPPQPAPNHVPPAPNGYYYNPQQQQPQQAPVYPPPQQYYNNVQPTPPVQQQQYTPYQPYGQQPPPATTTSQPVTLISTSHQPPVAPYEGQHPPITLYYDYTGTSDQDYSNNNNGNNIVSRHRDNDDDDIVNTYGNNNNKKNKNNNDIDESSEPHEKTPCQDKACVFAFIINLVVFIGILIYSFKFQKTTSSTTPTFDGIHYTTSQYIAFGIAVLSALVCSFGMLGLIKNNAYCMIFGMMILNGLSFLTIAIYGVYLAMYGGEPVWGFVMIILGLVFTGLYLILPFCFKKRIKFAAMMIKHSIPALTRYKGIFGVALGSLIIALGATIVTVAALVYLRDKTTNDEASGIWLPLVLLFTFYWIAECIRYTVHTTTAGVVGTYFYLPAQPTATVPALKRSLTTSFGSIAFAAGLLAVVQFLKMLARMKFEEERDDRDNGGAARIILMIIAACLHCLLSIIEDMLDFFNSWALVHVSLYGKSFCRAGKDTLDLLKNRGFTMYINDDLTSYSISAGALFTVALSALITMGIWVTGNGFDNFSTEHLVVTLIAAILIPLYISLIILGLISSAVQTLWVVLAEDPVAIQQNYPDVYNDFEKRRKEVWG